MISTDNVAGWKVGTWERQYNTEKTSNDSMASYYVDGQ